MNLNWMKNRLGLIALALAVVAIMLASIVVHAQSFYWDGSDVTVRWLEAHGYARHSPAATTAQAPSIFSINDRRALTLTTVLAYASGLIAIILALIAEVCNEDTQFLAAAIICAALAIVRMEPGAGLILMALSFIAVLVIRKLRNKQAAQ